MMRRVAPITLALMLAASSLAAQSYDCEVVEYWVDDGLEGQGYPATVTLSDNANTVEVSQFTKPLTFIRQGRDENPDFPRMIFAGTGTARGLTLTWLNFDEDSNSLIELTIPAQSIDSGCGGVLLS